MELDFSHQIKAADKQKKTLNKPFRTPDGPKKFSVYVKNDKGNIVKVNFGDPNMEIKRDDPNRRKNFRARHQCDSNPGPKWKARYWSCRMWESKKSVSDYIKGSINDIAEDWNGDVLWEENDLLQYNPELSTASHMGESEDYEMEEFHEQINEMTKSQLLSSVDKLNSILNIIRDDQNFDINCFEPWMLNKLTIIEDYVNSIHTNLVYNKEESSASKEEVKNNIWNKSTLDKETLKKLEEINKKIKPEEEGHEEEEGGFSEDEIEYQKKYELTQW